jgi:hypothetical protein
LPWRSKHSSSCQMNGGEPAGGNAAGAATGVPHAVFAIATGAWAAATDGTPAPRTVPISSARRYCVLITLPDPRTWPTFTHGNGGFVAP